jgi:hypothetical protein
MPSKTNLYRLVISQILMALYPLSVFASGFECSIKSVLRLNETGTIVTHGWSANYQNRTFTVDKETGKVTGTTALKARLSNYDRDAVPRILDHGDRNNAFKVITLFENDGQSAVLQIDKLPGENSRPFFYQTYIGMILTGTCTETS